ncbi:MAG TPA: hypothetical protein C5S51_10465 [Methanosarcinaceae archaeon]|nr:hypothetical protein [Methanosarcinaceae archaeon]
MRIKTIIVFLMLIATSVFFAGCIGDDDPVIEETIPVINETPEEVEIEEIPVEEPEVVEEIPAVDPQTYTIRMEHYMVRIPSPFEINRGDTVVWRNNQDPKRYLTVVSENGLWENTTLGYRQTLLYTFNESGTYNFSVIGQSRMSGSIVVN